jgi:hypothetical protein
MCENLLQYGKSDRRAVRPRGVTNQTTSVADACLIAAMFAGGLEVHPTWAAELETGTEAPGSRHLTVQECNNLGCHYIEAPTCPIILHDYLERRWACACPGGTSCLDESSPH